MTLISKTNEYELLLNYFKETETAINETYKELTNKEEELIASVKETKNKKNQRKLDIIQLYLSQSFGKYEKNKYIQEVSWNWMDLGILLSNKDLVGFYKRRIKENLPIGSTFWISPGKYN
jgi:hypothetical protein